MDELDGVIDALDEISEFFGMVRANVNELDKSSKGIDATGQKLNSILENLLRFRRALDDGSAIDKQIAKLNKTYMSSSIDTLFETMIDETTGTEFGEGALGSAILKAWNDPSIANRLSRGGIRLAFAGYGFDTKLTSVDMDLNYAFGDISEWADAVNYVRDMLGNGEDDLQRDPIKASKKWAQLWSNRESSLWMGIQRDRIGVLSGASPIPFWSILDAGNSAAESMSSNYGGYPTPRTPPTRFVTKAEKKIKSGYDSVVREAQKTFNAFDLKVAKAIENVKHLIKRYEEWDDFTEDIVDGGDPVRGIDYEGGYIGGNEKPSPDTLRRALEREFGSVIQLASDLRLSKIYEEFITYGDVVTIKVTADGRVELTGDYSLQRVRVSKNKLLRALGGI